MIAHQAYRRNAMTGWTRIDMLLAIYDAAISSVDAGIDALNRQDSKSLPAHQLRATQLILLLVEGLDPSIDESARRVQDLCVFCLRQIASGQAADWVSARDVLVTLREGFQGIREEAIELEARGEIPPLVVDSGNTVAHV